MMLESIPVLVSVELDHEMHKVRSPSEDACEFKWEYSLNWTLAIQTEHDL